MINKLPVVEKALPVISIAFCVVLFLLCGVKIGMNRANYTERITCLELNLGKETCDKIFKK